MRGLVYAALLVLLTIVAPACAADDKPLSMTVMGQVSIGKDGSVANATVDFGVPPAVSQLVLKAVRQWKFAPIVRNGASIEARTGYALKVTATPVPQGYAVRIDEVTFLNPRKPAQIGSLTGGRELHQAFAALVAIRVDAAGTVYDAQVLGLRSLTPGKQVHDPRKLNDAMTRFAKSLAFDPARTDLGDPPGFDKRITVTFNNPDALAGWHGSPEFTDAGRAPWEPEGMPGEAQLPSDISRMAAEPDVKLQSSVVGTTL